MFIILLHTFPIILALYSKSQAVIMP